MSFYTNNAIGASNSNRVRMTQGQNSQSLGSKINNVKAYFTRKMNKIRNVNQTTATTPRSKFRNNDASITINNMHLLSNGNKFNMLLDELDSIQTDLRTSMREETIIEEEEDLNFAGKSTSVVEKDIDNIINKDIDINTNDTENLTINQNGVNPGNARANANQNIANGPFNRLTNKITTDHKDELDKENSNLKTNNKLEEDKDENKKSVKITKITKKQVRYLKTDNELTINDINTFNSKVEKELSEFVHLLRKDPNSRMYDLTPIRGLTNIDRFQHVDAAIQSINIADNDCQTNSVSIEANVEENVLNNDQELFRIPKRRDINKIIKNKKIYKAHSRLLSYLRCKAFLKHRDTALIQQLVHMANVWMVKEGHLLDQPIHYSVIANAVTIAFLVSEEELSFREAIKNKTNWDNMKHLNNTIKGDLGKVYRLPLEKYLNESNPLHKVMDDLTLQEPSINI